jgi:hypothetical protein
MLRGLFAVYPKYNIYHASNTGPLPVATMNFWKIR